MVHDKRRLTSVLLLAGSLALAAFCLIYPIYIIQPFRRQGARELLAALDVVRYRAVPEALCVAIACLALLMYWQSQPSRWRRAMAVVTAAGVVLMAALSRVNIYEIMFHPVDRPAFASAAESKLDGDEMVIAVDVAGSARAYPIRDISYHHIVNDVVGGVPIVATY